MNDMHENPQDREPAVDKKKRSLDDLIVRAARLALKNPAGSFAAFMASVLSFVAIFLTTESTRSGVDSELMLSVVAVLFMGMSSAAALQYLRPRANRSITHEDTRARLAALERRLEARLHASSGHQQQGATKLSPRQMEELIVEVSNRLRVPLLDTLTGDARMRLAEAARLDAAQTTITKGYGETVKRLQDEVLSCNRRANLSLALGIMITVGALTVLTFFTWTGPPPGADWEDAVDYYLPRLTLTAFIEVFAYFFLRLHKRSLDDIRYYQNEITRLEERENLLACSLVVLTPHASEDFLSRFIDSQRTAPR